MPIIKSAKKRLKQSRKRQVRNYELRSQVKTYMKKVIRLCKEKNKEEALKALVQAYKTIDTACKKNLLHQNNAARKKSRLSRLVNRVEMAAASEETAK